MTYNVLLPIRYVTL